MKKIDNANKKSKRRGPLPRPAENLRGGRISVYVTKEELEEIRRRAGKKGTPSAFLRKLGLGKLPQPVPELNKKAWAELGKAASNLNQIAAGLNMIWKSSGNGLRALTDIEDIKADLDRFRKLIIGGSSMFNDYHEVKQ